MSSEQLDSRSTSHPSEGVGPFVGIDEQELVQLLEGATDGTWCYYPDRDEMRWSAGIIRLLGYDEQVDSLGDVLELTHPDDRARHRRVIERALAGGGSYTTELRLLRRDGKYASLSERGLVLPARQGRERCLVSFVLDISAAELSRGQLERTERLFRAFMDNCPAAVFLKDENGVHLYANNEAAAFIGVPLEELIGHKSSELLPPEVAERLAESDRIALESGEPNSSSYPIQTHAGRQRQVADVKFRIPHGVEGEGEFLIGGFSLDITKSHDQAERLAKLDLRLQESQRLESLGLLAGGVAHDFNNLLQTVIGSAEIALYEEDASERDEMINRVIERCRQAGELCQQLLLYSGRGSRLKGHVDLVELIGNASELTDAARADGVQLEVSLPHGLPSVLGDIVQLRQLLLNLVKNAAQASGPGARPIRIEVYRCTEPVNQPVFLDWVPSTPGAPHPEMVCVAVEDAGQGMQPEQMRRIFEPFYSKRPGGHGLGMATVLGIVKGHEGALGVRSTPGEGTRVEIYLRAGEGHSLRSEDPVRPLADLQGRRILAVDDQPEVLAVTSSLLRFMDLDARCCGSGKEALQLVARQTEPFELALLDVTMPDMSGLELAERILRLSPETRIVLTSGHVESGLAGIPREYEFLTKPFDLRSLAEALSDALAGS